jgi:uncharacterized protein (DUF305 family)
MFKHALFTGLLVVVASILGVVAAQMNESSQALMAAHEKMMKNMAMTPSGNIDMDFAMMMVPHHQGAIDMAEVELKHGKDTAMKEMAQKIIDTQKQEIEQFKKWQAEHM